MTTRALLLVVAIAFSAVPVFAEEQGTPYGSSSFAPFAGVDDLEQLKVVYDFNFADPAGLDRALTPVSFTLQGVHEYGPVSFEPVDIIVVSHGSEVVAFAKQNYRDFKAVVDRAARLAELGVKFEICRIAARVLGFEPDDFHGFVRVVPTGSYALIYHQNQGYALMPGASTVPGDLINPHNRAFLGRESD